MYGDIRTIYASETVKLDMILVWLMAKMEATPIDTTQRFHSLLGNVHVISIDGSCDLAEVRMIVLACSLKSQMKHKGNGAATHTSAFYE